MIKTKRLSLTHYIFIGLFLGIATGGLFGNISPVVSFAAFCSDIFLRLLKMIIVPLIITSIVSGIVGIGDPKNIGRLGAKNFYLLHFHLAPCYSDRAVNR
ncbi:MAG: cation:dicarboxylase symporter family transporter [bacterium]